jgi:hypothetical protein
LIHTFWHCVIVVFKLGGTKLYGLTFTVNEATALVKGFSLFIFPQYIV